MTEEVGEDEGRIPVAEAPLPLPLEFEAHYILHQEAFHDLALAVLGTNDAAERAVHRAFLEILRHWDKLKEESEDLDQEVWAIVRRTVISEELLSLRAQMTALDSGSGLYAALGALPPRQFDVMVLRYIGRHDTKHISWYMGLTPSTVDYHCRKARERLSPIYHRMLKAHREDNA
ncbi:sigma-70 family RNA polymerase sigma factor [Streptomyces sp. NPDC046805]|uniref:RNA polymerase sigma factor n=1 Tax=Streptomyces sp. NPDC046805 TaxID=3155134 RepID=UPI0033C61D30